MARLAPELATAVLEVLEPELVPLTCKVEATEGKGTQEVSHTHSLSATPKKTNRPSQTY